MICSPKIRHRISRQSQRLLRFHNDGTAIHETYSFDESTRGEVTKLVFAAAESSEQDSSRRDQLHVSRQEAHVRGKWFLRSELIDGQMLVLDFRRRDERAGCPRDDDGLIRDRIHGVGVDDGDFLLRGNGTVRRRRNGHFVAFFPADDAILQLNHRCASGGRSQICFAFFQLLHQRHRL